VLFITYGARDRLPCMMTKPVYIELFL